MGFRDGVQPGGPSSTPSRCLNSSWVTEPFSDLSYGHLCATLWRPAGLRSPGMCAGCPAPHQPPSPCGGEDPAQVSNPCRVANGHTHVTWLSHVELVCGWEMLRAGLAQGRCPKCQLPGLTSVLLRAPGPGLCQGHSPTLGPSGLQSPQLLFSCIDIHREGRGTQCSLNESTCTSCGS